MSKQDGSGRLVSGPEVDDSATNVLHVDLDAFFATASLLSRPELRGLPVVIGSDGPRSVVTAATYEARQFGVFSAMPMARAKQLCPQAIVIEGDFPLYRRLSGQVMAILHDVSPEVEVLGIDEAFVFVQGARKLLGRPYDIAQGIRRRVREETGLIASVGVAENRFLAKLASTQSKPDGLLVIPPQDAIGWLHAKPVEALWGVGPALAGKLHRYGIHTVEELAHTSRERLQGWVGQASGAHLHNLAWGRDERPLETRDEREKSVGHSHTFNVSLTDRAGMRSELARLSGGVATRLRKAGLGGRGVTLTVRYDDFTTLTRQLTLPAPTDTARVITDAAWRLLEQVNPQQPVRLLGVSVSRLAEPEAAAPTLFDDEPEESVADERWSAAERTVDELEARFGKGAIGPASALRLEQKRHDFGQGDS